MNATEWKDAGRTLGKRARSRGSKNVTNKDADAHEKHAGSCGNEIGTKRKRIEERTRELSREFETCRKFITKNLSFRDSLERDIRQLVTLRETMQSSFKKWRHSLGCARDRLARFEAELLDDDEDEDDDDDDVWDRLDEIVEETMEEGIELERRVRLLTTTVVQLERHLMSHKMEHESLHVRLCEKLVYIIRSRRCVTAKFYEIAKTKNGTREYVDSS